MADDFKYRDQIEAQSSLFGAALKAAVDYRGDCTVELSDGRALEGYIYNSASDRAGKIHRIDLFPKNSPRAESILSDSIVRITFSGEDTASGKSWEDWMKKKDSERAAIKAASLEDLRAT